MKRLRGEGYYSVIKYDRIATNKQNEVVQELLVQLKLKTQR